MTLLEFLAVAKHAIEEEKITLETEILVTTPASQGTAQPIYGIHIVQGTQNGQASSQTLIVLVTNFDKEGDDE
jgi:hypothetical protein